MKSRLCAIYLRDVVQFGDPTLINECRQVSRRCDTVICTTPEARLPRRYFYSNIWQRVGALFNRCSVGSEPYPLYLQDIHTDDENAGVAIDANGFVGYRDNASFWHNNPVANACRCQEELKWLACRLAGRCLVKCVAPEMLVQLDISDAPGEPYIAQFWAQNQLTAVTALGFLHLMRHLGTAILCMELLCKLNWDLVQADGFDAESRFTHQIPRLHCCVLGLKRELSVDLIPRATRFLASCHTLEINTDGKGSGAQFPGLLATLKDASRGNVKKLVLNLGYEAGLSAENIDNAVNFFQRECLNLETCIPHVAFSVAHVPFGGWPSSCSPREAGRMLKPDKQWTYGREGAWEYVFINKPSGRKFRVWLELERFYEQKRIRYLHFLF